jgi:putative methanogenesis marker 16 metalloprotein
LPIQNKKVSKKRTLEEINKKIEEGSAVIMTAQEICQQYQKGKTVTFDEVDVVTTATKGLMSGTSAILAFRIGNPGDFTKVKELSMNDINCYVGPCPNETLGLVDLILYATDKSKTNPKYGAGHLLRDLVERKKIKVHAVTVEDTVIDIEITLDDIYFAQMMGIRHAFRNYNSFVNPSKESIKSIFTVLNMEPNLSEISFCGCGVINPLENDPEMDILGVGTPVLINGALGHIIGSGTRSSPQRPNLMTIAPLFEMKGEYMGGFQTANGPEVICTIGAAIPILNEKIFNNLKLTDKFVPLNLVDIVGRKVLATTDYSQVWRRNLMILFKKGICDSCELVNNCPVVDHCPTDCFTPREGMDRSYCFNCGTCIRSCPKNACSGDLGAIEYEGKKIPVVLRQSDRKGAISLMEDLRKKIISGEFQLALPTAKPKIYVEKVEKNRDHIIESN